MEDNDKIRNQTGGRDNQQCECEGNCCPPKKSNMTPKIIFTIILLAAIGVIAFKLVNKPAPAAVKESCCPAKNSTGCDTTTTTTCDTTKTTSFDTTKGSSCCPK